MNLQYIKEETCPTCGAMAVYEEISDRVHVNGKRNESRRFACGAKISFSAGLNRYDNGLPCPNEPQEIEKRKKYYALISEIKALVEASDIDERAKQTLLSRLAYGG